MAHTYRFFAVKISSGYWQLEDDEVTHALKVLRLADGESVEVTDGQGVTGVGQLKIESKSKVSVINVKEACHPKDSWVRAVLLGALKPGDVDELLAPLVELGVDKILVYRQEETPKFRVSDNSSVRWQRLVRSALKQSKRPWSVSVEAFDSLGEALGEVSGFEHKWILLPEAERDLLSVEADLKTERGAVVALVGGEKGFSANEETKAKSAGFMPVRLGPWVLRARTAAPAVAVFLGMLPRSK